MLARERMSKDVIRIKEKDSIQDAIKVLKEHDVRMLPVMKKGKLVGVITDRDLKRASASDATELEIHEVIYILPAVILKLWREAQLRCKKRRN